MKKIIKILVFIICLALIAGIVYFLVTKPEIESSKNNEQNAEQDIVADLVGKIEGSVGVDFISKGETSFDWIIDVSEIGIDRKTISGVLYQIDDTTMAKYFAIEKFFVKNYEENINTGADGVSGGQRGFIVDSSVCLLSFRHNQLLQHENAPTEVVGDSRTVKIECGELN